MVDDRTASIQPERREDWLLLLVERLIAELEAEGISDPLAEPFTLGCVLADLLDLAGVPVPAHLATVVAAPQWPVALPSGAGRFSAS